jgi:hypothetical protein
MADLGIRLQLMIGPTIPIPAPGSVMDALVGLEVQNNDRDFDAFGLSFHLGRDSVTDYGLVRDGYLSPPNRVIITVIINGMPEVLMDGVITRHRLIPSNKPGESTLQVYGKDISYLLSLEEKNETYRNQSDSTIVTMILARYGQYGFIPALTQTTDIPVETERVPTQQGTDLAFIRELAQRNGFVFYIEPTFPGASTAYWGAENRTGLPQPPLTIDIGPDSNIDSPLTFEFNADRAEEPQVTILEPMTKMAIPVPLPASLLPSLSGSPVQPMRKTIPRNTANLSMIQALLRGLTGQGSASESVGTQGVVDAMRYGRVLRSRRLVSVRGSGNTYGGTYYVQQVTHKIKRGEYTQNFTLVREGLGSTI